MSDGHVLYSYSLENFSFGLTAFHGPPLGFFSFHGDLLDELPVDAGHGVSILADSRALEITVPMSRMDVRAKADG